MPFWKLYPSEFCIKIATFSISILLFCFNVENFAFFRNFGFVTEFQIVLMQMTSISVR